MNARLRIIEFWKWFMSIESSLYDILKHNQVEQLKGYEEIINQKMEPLCGCKLEFEAGDEYMEMTCNTGERKNIQYLCGLWKQCAPKELQERWIINAFRQPLSDKALHSYFEIKGKRYTGLDLKVYYTIDEALKMLQLQIYCQGFCAIEKKAAKEIALYLLELFIGELELEARIGSVEILDSEIDADNVVLLPNLYEDICDIVIDQEWVEYHDPTQIYLAYKLDELIHNESLRKDMKIIATSHPLLFEEIMNHETDQLIDFKQYGGEYGYLYYEHEDRKEEEALLRGQLEKQIHELLYPLGIARTIGGAYGSKYAYIDIAVFDKAAFYQALEKMNEQLPIQFTYRAFEIRENEKE